MRIYCKIFICKIKKFKDLTNMFLPNEDFLWVSIYNIVTAINQIKLSIRDALAEMHLFPLRDQTRSPPSFSTSLSLSQSIFFSIYRQDRSRNPLRGQSGCFSSFRKSILNYPRKPRRRVSEALIKLSIFSNR